MSNLVIKEVSANNFLDLQKNLPFTQADFYGDWQIKFGRTVKRFAIYREEKIVVYFQIVKYPLLLGKSYLYTPYGPLIFEPTAEVLVFLKVELKKIARQLGAAFVRLDFTPAPADEKLLSGLYHKAPAYTYHSAHFQPRTEWRVRLDKTEDDLMLTMHEKCRYSIRLAQRKEITTEIISANFNGYFEAFYSLMAGTAERNGFHLHKKDYYQNIFNNLSTIKNSFLVIAKYKEKILAINLIIVYSGTANYVFGASSNDERNRAPTYLAQWAGIQQAKKIGCDFYNFGGISSANDKHVSWDGLTAFKQKFGGEELKHSNFYDLIVSPFWYFLYNLRKRFKK